MRTTIACHRCRSAKVKCRHSGTAPCAGCTKTGNHGTCVLSGPVIKRTVKSRTRSSTHNNSGNLGALGYETLPSGTGPAPASHNGLSDLVQAIPQESLGQALSLFQTQFPEVGFLQPEDFDMLSDFSNATFLLRMTAIYAVASRHMSPPDDRRGADCAALAALELKKQMTNYPDIYMAQAAAVMALYAWSESETYSAWMYAGTATRMANELMTLTPESATASVESEVVKRTIWTCHAVEWLLCCGKSRRMSLQFSDLGSMLPLGDRTTNGDMDDSFPVIMQGIHLWAKVRGWVVDGGRRQTGMTEPHNCPWQSDSHWALLLQEVEDWRAAQDARLRYPETKVAFHAHRRRAEPFAYINLLYYLCIAFLRREWVPFLAVGQIQPRGPIDPPLLQGRPPDGFWEQNLNLVFNSAANLSDIMADLRRCGASIRIPLASVSAFTSALMLGYAVEFPAYVGPTIHSNAAAKLTESMTDLTRISQACKLGEEWLRVLEVVKDLMKRANRTGPTGVQRSSRYDYVELEDSINLARGREGPRSVTASDYSPSAAQLLAESAKTTEGSGGMQADRQLDSAELNGFTSLFDNDAISDNGWMLWSFWDDPHLLQTIASNDDP